MMLQTMLPAGTASGLAINFDDGCSNIGAADRQAFDTFSNTVPDTLKERPNFCPDCDVAMIISQSEYQCPNCGQLSQFIADVGKEHEEGVSGNIKITSGSARGKIFTFNPDYSRTQHKYVLDQLKHNNNQYTGNKFSPKLLRMAADMYNHIQKTASGDEGKFVRRGDIKDELIAACLYYVCIQEGASRRKGDVAEMMRLPARGFSRGEDILRELHNDGIIEIPADKDPYKDFLERYLESLNLDKSAEYDRYRQFVLDLVEESERLKIGMNSQIGSKIVGALSILIQQLKLNITDKDLEKAADKTKKNTYDKFRKAVFDNLRVFSSVFDKHNIPYAKVHSTRSSY